MNDRPKLLLLKLYRNAPITLPAFYEKKISFTNHDEVIPKRYKNNETVNFNRVIHLTRSDISLY